MSQATLGGRVKLSRTSIVNIECGRHRIQIHVLYEIARVLGVDPRRHLLPPLRADEASEEDLPQGLERQLEKELGKVSVRDRAQVAALVNRTTKIGKRG
jgi:transcriptional regulator with XRE-family HTH domain